MALPGNAHAPPFAPVPSGGFALTRKGIGQREYMLVDQLAQAFPPATFTEVLADADLRAARLTGLLGGRADGYRWAREDDETPDWYPQGITGSSDADPRGLVCGRAVHAVSWYSKRGRGARVSFVDARPEPRYLHVLLVRPTGSERFELVKLHAGGIAWLGDLLYVADSSRHGLRVFDTRLVLSVPRSRRADAHGHRYMLPEVGCYRSTGDHLAYSFLSLDRAARSLLVGEYRQAPGGRIVRWPVDLDSGLLAASSPTEACVSPVDRLQGATTVGGVVLASSSRMGGRLYVGRPGARTRKHFWWPYLPEDLYQTPGELYSLTEAPGRRMVFGVALSELGL